MDYTKVPRFLIYQRRTDLNDFGVKTPGTLNNRLFTQMRKMPLLRCGDAREIALRCFNNAYYICTLTQLEEFPDLCNDRYEALLYPAKIPWPKDVYQASMAMVCVLLAAYDDKYKQQDEPLIASIRHWTSHNKWMGDLSHASFEGIFEACSADGVSLPPDVFAPRDIVELIDSDEALDNEYIFAKHIEYVVEALTHVSDARRRTYGADLLQAKLKDYFKFINNSDEFHEYVDDVPLVQSALDYLNAHRAFIDKCIAPTPVGTKVAPVAHADVSERASVPENVQQEISQLKKQIAELTEQLKEAEQTITQLQERVADYAAKYDPVDIKKKKFPAMTGKQHVILYLSFLAYVGRLPNARENLSWEVSFMSSCNESSCKDYLKRGITDRECEKLAANFNETTPFVANIIKELPGKIKQNISDKNSAKRLKNDK